MLLLIHAPMLAILGGLIAAFALCDAVNLYFIFTAPVFAAGLLFCSEIFNENLKKIKQTEIFLIIILIALACSTRIFYVFSRPEISPKYINTTGTVTLMRPWGKIYAAVIKTQDGNFLINTHLPNLIEGEVIEISGEINPFKNKKSGFNELKFWRARGVDAKISRLKIKSLDIDIFSIYYLRFKISRFINIYMPKITGAYLKAAWLGERDADINNLHRTLGTSHLLAVSGFHVGIAALIASFIFGKKRVILISIFLWCYALLTGAAPSALRAALMFQASVLARIAGRPANPVNGVSVAAVILLFYSPYLFYDIGWRLSVIAALTITALFNAPEIKNIKNNFYKTLLLSPAVALTTFAQSAHTFGGIPAAGFLFNLFVPFLFSIAFSVASIAAFLYFLKIPFAKILLNASEANFAIFHKLSEKILNIFPVLKYKIPWNFIYAFLSAFTLIFLLSRAVKISLKRSVIIAIAGACFALIIFL